MASRRSRLRSPARDAKAYDALTRDHDTSRCPDTLDLTAYLAELDARDTNNARCADARD